MAYITISDPLAVNFDFSSPYTVITDPLAVNFDFSSSTGVTGVSRSILGFSEIDLASTATMAFVFDPDSNITGESRLIPPSATVLSGADFNITINVRPVRSNVTITSVQAVLQEGDSGTDIAISNTNSSFILAGAYLSAFAHKFTYTDAGESDKTQIPKTVTYFSNLPPGKNLFKLEQDNQQSVDIRYDVKVTYTITIPGPVDSDPVTQLGTEFLTFTHTVNQNLEAIRKIMQEYKYNGTGALA